MAAGDLHRAVQAVVVHGEVHGGRGNHAQRAHVHPGGGDPVDDGRGQRRRALADVHADRDHAAAPLGDGRAVSAADRAHGAEVEILADEPADVVFTEDVRIHRDFSAVFFGTGFRVASDRR